MVQAAGLELQLFFRQFLSVICREERLEGTFNLLYGMNGGLTLSQVQTMKRKDFNWFLERLSNQKERENEEIERARSGTRTPAPSGKMKYLGR